MKKTNNKKKGFDISVHYSIEGRKKFKLKMWLIFLGFVLFEIGCSCMVMFGGWNWDPQSGFSPTTDPKQPYQYALIWLGAIFALGAIVGWVVYCVKELNAFFKTQAEYFQTKDFKDKQAKVLSSDLSKCKKSLLKWYKKLGYIKGPDVKNALEKARLDKKDKKNNA